jgi:ammonia channel protein AmtB
VDDVVDAVPVHLGGGLWSVIATGLFASPRRLEAAYGSSKHVGWFYSWGRGSADATLLAANVMEVLFIIGWVSVTMIPFFLLLNYLGWFRSDPLDELVGLDVRYHEAAIFKRDKKIVLVSGGSLLGEPMDSQELSLSDSVGANEEVNPVNYSI